MRDINRRRAAFMLNTIYARQYYGLCELLGGWRNDDWVSLAYGNGEPTVREFPEWVTRNGEPVGERYGLSRRIYFDLDYEDYVLTQVWDHNAEKPEWEFILLFNTGSNEWVPEQVWSWGNVCPSYAEAGAVVDEIQFLRYAK